MLWSFAACWMLALPMLGQNPNVTVDDQPTAEQRLEEVLELRRATRYAEAADLIQELIGSASFELVSVGEGRYADASRWASDVLMRDAALRQVYVERHSAAAARQLDQAKANDETLDLLLAVYRLYSATPAGLQAGMDAAGLLLATGQPQSAATLIEALLKHPDRATAAARLQMLRGAAAAYRQDVALLDEAREDLAELDPVMADALAALADSIVPASVTVRPAHIDMGPKPISIRAPLWDQALATADNARRWLQKDRAVVPVITPSFVLINNGRQIVAIDRASGQRAWVIPEDEDNAVQRLNASQRWEDERAVARGGGRAVATLGECMGITERRNPYVPPNRLVCVDEQTGKLVWERVAGDFRPDEPTRLTDRRAGRLNLQLTHFVGTPIINDGTVYVALRRANSENDSQSSWVLAYDAADGSLLWYRHLALVSLSYTNADSMRVGPKLSLVGDTLYASDGLGTIGAIDRQTGSYRWLRVLPVGSENTRSIVASSRGVSGKPVMTDAGLLVPLTLSNHRLMLVDPSDGSVLRSFQQDPVLSKTQYILETHRGALAVSQTSVSLWDADRAAVKWTFAFAPGETLRGKGDVSLRFAVLPTSERLIVLDLATGDLLDQADAVKGSVAIHDREVLAVSDGRLHAFTSWDRVYNRLVQQVEDRPDDPSAGLSLASIAMRQQDQNDSVLLGIGHALDAVAQQPIRRRPAVASHVFEQLRILIPQTDDATLRSALYERMALVTQTAEHEAAYHLDAGLYFAEQGQTQRAVDHLHAVVAEPAFAASSYIMDGMAQPAGAIARQTIQDLIERYGRGVYARQDALAQARIDQLKASGQLDASALTAVAKRFPLSPLAGRLLLEAAEARANEGRLIAAASLYKQAFQRSADDAQRQVAAGRLLQFYLDTKRPRLASDFLARLSARHPELAPIADGQALSLPAWASRLAEAPARPAEASPLSAALGTPLLVPGRLIPRITTATTHDAGPATDRDRVYLLQGDSTLACHAFDDPAEALWTSAQRAGAGRVKLLMDASGLAVFWAVDDGSVFALDRETGERRWRTAVSFETPQQAGGDPAQRMLIAVSETVLCLGDRDTAQVLAIDLASGDTLWRTTLEMTALTALAADNWSLAAVGRAGHPQQLRSGKLAVLSLADAQPTLPERQVRVALTPFGVDLQQDRVTVLGVSGVMAFQTSTGNPLWTQRASGSMLSGVYAVAGQRIAVETNTGELQLLDASNSGKIIDTLPVRGGGDRIPTQIVAEGDTLWCLSERGLYRFGPDGLDWSHRSQTNSPAPRGLVLGSDYAAILAKPNPAPFDNGLTIDIVETSGGRQIDTYQLGPLPEETEPTQASRLAQGLAIPAGSQTIIVPPATIGEE
jgi:outer membrane protein assembly factor BamB